ncbi:hypothetical protein [Paenibacillus terrigena]|nr:hypothetical protein [Paenibacillus terrigena]
MPLDANDFELEQQLVESYVLLVVKSCTGCTTIISGLPVNYD